MEHAIILAGGFGTRLRPLTLDLPKPLMPVNKIPFLETQFHRLAEAGIRKVVLSVCHDAHKIKAALKTLKKRGLKVEIRREPEPLGTGGAIRFAWPDPAKPALVLNGDVLTDFKIKPMLGFHRQTRSQATLWSLEMEDTRAFGVLELGRQGEIRRFVEKPRPGETRSRTINAGLYCLEPAVREMIPAGRPVSVERETFPGLLVMGMKASAFVTQGNYWNDIGTPAAYLAANLHLNRGRSVFGRGCRIAKGALIEGSVLLDGCEVGEGAQLKGVILGRGCRIGARAVLREGAVLGRGCVITEGSHA